MFFFFYYKWLDTLFVCFCVCFTVWYDLLYRGWHVSAASSGKNKLAAEQSWVAISGWDGLQHLLCECNDWLSGSRVWHSGRHKCSMGELGVRISDSEYWFLLMNTDQGSACSYWHLKTSRIKLNTPLYQLLFLWRDFSIKNVSFLAKFYIL